MRYRYLIIISALKIRHPANHAQSCFRFYSWNAENGCQREFLMRVDKCTMSKEQRSRARGHNYNPGQVWCLTWLDCIYVTNKHSLLQAPWCCLLQALNTDKRRLQDCRTSGAGAEGRGQHPGNENKLCSSDAQTITIITIIQLWMRPCVQTNCTEDVWNRNILRFPWSKCHWSRNGGRWWNGGWWR